MLAMLSSFDADSLSQTEFMGVFDAVPAHQLRCGHAVAAGDTLGAIARKYGTTVTNICRLNGIKSTTTLRIGRSLRVR